jgi:uncharacterized coiled-coil protein SlyX
VMAADLSTVGGSADLGKALFGYRRSDVVQLIADRDLLLEAAEKRMRASEARIAELEKTLSDADGRNAATEEQLGRLQTQVDALVGRSAEVEKLALRVRAEGERVAAWRKRLQITALTMAPAVERFRVLLAEVPVRMEGALRPVATNAPALLARLDACAKTIQPSDQAHLEFRDLSR